MTSAYLVDTNHVSAAIYPVSKFRERLYQAHRSGARFGTCIPVLCELEAGIQVSPHAKSYRRQLLHLRKYLRVWPLGEQIATAYGEVFHELRRLGRIASQVDMILAAFARIEKLTILTADKDFAALSGIRAENWLE